MISHNEFSGFLQALHSDIRFEVILADLLDDSLNLDEVVIESESLFKRNYHHDIENASEIEYGAGRKKKLRFVVNREGIYDQLPEDLFHQVTQTNNVTDKYEAIQEIKEHRDLEKQSRLFFQPLEQEFYAQRIRLEIEERKFLFETNDILPGEIFDQLWDLPEFLNDLQKSKLGLLMPVIHKLTGQKELLSFVFESITGDPVQIRETVPRKYRIDENPNLGSMQLSIDSILAGYVCSLQPAVTMVIHISDMENLLDYMPAGKKMILHEYLCNLFMPLDSEIIFDTSFAEKAKTFLIENDSVFQGRLNYTTII
jgi:hypothetical protein